MAALTYHRASTSWLDRLPLGDGRLGAMVGASSAARRIGLNESSAWSGGVASAQRDLVDPTRAATALAEARSLLLADEPVAAERALDPLQHRYAQAFLPVGELTVTAPGAPGTVTRRLDLDTGTHLARWPGATATTLVSAARGVVVHAEAYEHATDAEITLTTPLRTRESAWHEPIVTVVLDLPADVAPEHEPDEPSVTWDLPDVRPVRVVMALAVRHDGVESRYDDRIVVHDARSLEVVVAIETTFTGMGREPGRLADARARAVGSVTAAAAADDLVNEHAVTFSSSGPAFSLVLGGADGGPDPDPDERVARVAGEPVTRTDPGLLALLVEYGVYLLRCSSRDGGIPANLQGIWNAQLQPPWSSAYTLNINTPMNYWGAEATGLSGAHRALLGLLEALAARGADTAQRLYGCRGWVAHHNSDAWGYTLPTRGDASWSQWPLGGAWLVRQLDEQRRHGAMTAGTLARFWPVARDCARFLLDWLTEIDGELHMLPSTSPENRYLHRGVAASLTISSALDRALVREVLRLVCELGDDVGEPGCVVVREARAALTRIAPARASSDGRIAEWGEDRTAEDPFHRHLSQLYEWFPGDGGDPVLDGAATRSLDTRGDDSTGWSLVWKLGLRARLGDATAVARLLDLLVRPAREEDPHRGGLYPNLFAAHPPFQIDGNLGFVGAFLESLVQSHRPGRLDLLPALPPALSAGTLRGFVARPGIVLDLTWQDACPLRLRLRARNPRASGTVRVMHAGEHHDVHVPVTGAIDLTWPPSASRPLTTTTDWSAT